MRFTCMDSFHGYDGHEYFFFKLQTDYIKQLGDRVHVIFMGLANESRKNGLQ